MIYTNLLNPTENRNIVEQKGNFTVLEYERDLSVDEHNAMEAFYAAQMNLKKRVLVASLKDHGVILQSGTMQMMLGNVKAGTDVSGATDLFKKALSSAVTSESVIKPHYTGSGVVVLEPTYHYLLIEDVADWNGALTVEDGMFLACSDTVQLQIQARDSLSSAFFGREGLFNTKLTGAGYVVLESEVPREELIQVELQDDELRIDGNYAVCWSSNLKFTVEKTTKTLTGSLVSGEGLVNVFRGTGRVYIAPVRKGMYQGTPPKNL
ncbi:MAG: AIM24 family protein [Lachnospiraceae bacterium]|nr:AIM24 family protein [Lachnospiraceae bacterium]